MHPILFTIFNHDIRSYSVFFGLAAAIVCVGTIVAATKRGFPTRPILITIFASLIAAILGARLLNVAINLHSYLTNPDRIWSLDPIGFSLFGGILAAGFVGFICCRLFRLNAWKLGDTAAPFIGLGIVSMRIGCFLNGCCFGQETDLPWGVEFPILSPAHKYQLASGVTDFFTVRPVHPTELYELVAALITAVVATYIIQKKLPDGTAVLASAIFFSAFRWFDSYIRINPPSFDAPSWFYPLFYAGIIVGCGGMIWRKMRTNPAPPMTPSGIF